jgi:hypothetical protein
MMVFDGKSRLIVSDTVLCRVPVAETAGEVTTLVETVAINHSFIEISG